MLSRIFRPTKFAGPEILTATRRFDYENLATRNKKHKAAAKERRRITRAKKSDINKTPADLGEETPPFLIPPRYKLVLKYLQAHKNSSRLHRKPIPEDRKEAFAKHAKEYAMYV